ncbi:NADPH-dependent FMN reductase [Saccharospirillum impatiens]|uniref:NADPH-dependent FMN reductase n=1 Tax=Saccharospirillum impatiens TaxID=169438 RepID=UPI0003FF9D9F|nr:NAD(P)H-dependent oxidoreductase [Saccharospirillum impatiens]
MKILSFAATSSKQSINKQLVAYASEQLIGTAGPDAEVEFIDLNDYEMPIYSIDRERESGVPPEAQTFFSKVREADAVLISFAEHNGTYTVAFKNVFDWASRIEMRLFEGKPMALFSTSLGPGGGKNVLRTATEALPFFGADVRGSFSLPDFFVNFDSEANRPIQPEHQNKLSQVLDNLLTDISATA